MKGSRRKPRVLAVSSGGGHWVQLLRLQKAFEDCDIAYATVLASSKADIKNPNARFYVLPDATRWNKLRLLWLIFRVTLLLLRERPDVVITTGAAPGYLALTIGKLLRKRTCWIDSIANVDELSLSGKKAGRWATLWLTQWPNVAKPEGPYFRGNVMGTRKEETVEELAVGEDPSSSLTETAHASRSAPQSKQRRPLVLAVSSGGGHWVELMRLRPAFKDCDVTFVSVHEQLAIEVEESGARYYCVPDVTRWSRLRVPWAFLKLLKILLTEKPDVIVTTGAAPGYLACVAGKLLGIRSCWIDSIANSDRISLSGSKARRWLSLLLTQWPKLEQENGPKYKGNVL